MHWAARQPRPITFAAAVSSPAALSPPLRTAGCLDWQLKVPALGLQGRAALLLAGFRAKGLGFDGGLQGLEALAGRGLEGFDARDLQLVVDRAVHSALRRGMAAAAAAAASGAGVAAGAAGAAGAGVAAAGSGGGVGCGQHGEAHQMLPLEKLAGHSEGSKAVQQHQQQQQLLVMSEDVQAALSGFVAAAFWRAGQHKAQQQQAEGGLQGWEDVGEWNTMHACNHHACIHHPPWQTGWRNMNAVCVCDYLWSCGSSDEMQARYARVWCLLSACCACPVLCRPCCVML
jgi:hypothetical protein